MERGTTKKKKRRFINEHLVATLDATDTSDRRAVRIITATVQALEINLKEVVVSRTSIQRIRKANRQKTAETIKETFKVNFQNVNKIKMEVLCIDKFSFL